MLTQHNFPDDFNRPSINSIYQRLRANHLFNSSSCLLPSGGVTVSNPDWHVFHGNCTPIATHLWLTHSVTWRAIYKKDKCYVGLAHFWSISTHRKFWKFVLAPSSYYYYTHILLL